MRKKIVAGNWKMNKDANDTNKLIKQLNKRVKGLKLKKTKVLIAPTFVNLVEALKKTKKSKIKVIAQNMHQAEGGAFTGEISASMLKAIGVKTVILGHSERRAYFGEDDIILTEKVNKAIEHKLEIIFCFGEKLEDRENEKHFDVIKGQLENVLFHLDASAYKKIILAYEPVWAIGTGKTASADQAQEMHAFIRGLLLKKYNEEIAENVSILYGGSVKPDNAREIFSKPDVDGGLIGGAALNADDFIEIVKSF